MINRPLIPGPSPVRGEGNVEPSAVRKVAVVGAGWAGCAAAVELISRGHHVTLFEAARTLGGRARCVDIGGNLLDNGQHILLGAYSETLRMMRKVGIKPHEALLRLPLQMYYPDARSGMQFATPRLPAPLHMLFGLLRAKGLASEDKLSLARFSTTARWMGWQLHDDCSVTELLERFDQTDRLIRLMWQPLCIAALNTPPERASAQVFLNVLRDSLGARRAASDMLIPRADLTALFPEQAAAYVRQHGGAVECGVAVRELLSDGARWRLETGNGAGANACFDAVIIATQPAQAAALLDGHADIREFACMQHEPITTCYLQYAPQLALDRPFYALIDDAEKADWGQFVFDRGHLNPHQAGLLAVVVSTSSAAIESGHAVLTAAIANQLASAFRQPALASPMWTKVISEKRATFSCTPGLARPGNAVGVDGIVIAGDYTAGDYPATLESAVRSGIKAAQHIAS